MKHKLLLFLLGFVYMAHSQPSAKSNEKRYKKWLRGGSYTQELSYRWLSDNPRYKFAFSDTTITDEEAVQLRNEFEVSKWSYSFGALFERPISVKKSIFFQTGFNLSNFGERIVIDKVTDPRLIYLVAGVAPEETHIKNNYFSFDIPLGVRFNFGQNSRYDTKRTLGSYLKFSRNFTALLGLQMSYLLSDGSPYPVYSDNSFVIRGVAGIGISQGLSEKMMLNIMLTGKQAINPLYLYDALGASYYSVGLTAQLLFKKEIKKKKKAPIVLVDACNTRELKPSVKKKRRKAIFGFNFGANVSLLTGLDAAKNDIEYHNGNLELGIEPQQIEGGKTPLISPTWNLHAEFNFLDNKLGLFTDIGFLRTGYSARYKYTNGPEYVKALATIKQSKINVPIDLKIAMGERAFFFLGGHMAYTVKDRINFSAQYFNNSSPSASFSILRYVSDTQQYFEEKLEKVTWGYEAGLGIILNDNVDFMIKGTKSGRFLKEDKNLSFINTQATLTYLFTKR